MRNYKIVYCFLDRKGNVQRDENDLEEYFIEIIEAYNGGDAIDKLKEKEKFIDTPQIVDIREVQNERVM